jgi:hypothetical protein
MNNKNIKIEDNFLNQEEFNKIRNIMTGVPDEASAPYGLPWYYTPNYYEFNDEKKSSSEYWLPDVHEPEICPFLEEGHWMLQFTHTFYEFHTPRSPYMDRINCILERWRPASISRIRANLLTRLPDGHQKFFSMHGDMENLQEDKQKQWTVSIFYVNTNDGYTVFEDGTKVESVANRMLTFPADMKHAGTTCTDRQTRIVINFNYFTQ